MVTDGVPPADAAVLRRREQVQSAAVVGVDDVTFLGHPGGIVEYGLDLRRAIAPANPRAPRHPDHRHTRADGPDERRAAVPQPGRPPGRRRRRARRCPRRRQPVDLPRPAR
jgi:hypothetical protein